MHGLVRCMALFGAREFQVVAASGWWSLYTKALRHLSQDLERDAQRRNEMRVPIFFCVTVQGHHLLQCNHLCSVCLSIMQAPGVVPYYPNISGAVSRCTYCEDEIYVGCKSFLIACFCLHCLFTLFIYIAYFYLHCLFLLYAVKLQRKYSRQVYMTKLLCIRNLGQAVFVRRRTIVKQVILYH